MADTAYVCDAANALSAKRVSQHEAYTTAIRDWYMQHGRHELPWRQTDDVYAIYISEVMLQQTQVATVLARYYFPFLKRFPTLQALADAPLDDVLKQWEGLGYYSRARNLHKAAQMAAPTLPGTIEGLMALPGIGRNTAHAIAALAYHQPVALMEANVKRVLHRLEARTAMTDAKLWQQAQTRVDADDPFTYNQAMMDIGSQICTPTRPACLICPVANWCKGRDDPLAYPAKEMKKTVPVRKRMLLVLRSSDGHYYLMPRTTRFLGGLYGFLEYETLPNEVLGQTIAEGALKRLGQVRQTYSHFRLNAEIIQYDWMETMRGQDGWWNIQEITQLPLSEADKKVVRLFR